MPRELITAHLTIYTADFGTTEGRGCGRGEEEDRPRAGIVEFAHHGSSDRSFRCLVGLKIRVSVVHAALGTSLLNFEYLSAM